MRVLLLGVGRIGALHAAHLGADERVGGLLVVDTDQARRDAVCSGISRAAPARGLDEALDLGFDAAVVATPSPRHFDQVSRILDAEVPVFCEKPLALTVEQVLALGERAKPGGLMVGFQRRFDDGYLRLREACAAARGRGCPPTLYRLATGDPYPPPASYLAVSGSIYHDMLIHDFDVLGFICPEIPVTVWALGSAAGLDGEMPGWGTATAVCQFGDGSLAVVTGSRTTGGRYEVSCQVTSPAGVVAMGLVDRWSPYHHLDGADGSSGAACTFMDRFRAAYARELAHFLDVVEGAPLQGAGPREMAQALRLADAAAESARRVQPDGPLGAPAPSFVRTTRSSLATGGTR